MIASSHGTPVSDADTAQTVEDVNAEPTANVDSVDRLDSVDSVVSLRVDRLVNSVYHSALLP